MIHCKFLQHGFLIKNKTTKFTKKSQHKEHKITYSAINLCVLCESFENFVVKFNLFIPLFFYEKTIIFTATFWQKPKKTYFCENNQYHIMPYLYIESPIGTIEIQSNVAGICEVTFVEEKLFEPEETPILLQCAKELEAYFLGESHIFEVKLSPKGTDFQYNVWEKLQEIPFGTTQSYMDIAHKLGDGKKVRAVGMANGKNPIAIIIPCHRVIGGNGKLIGYAGGLGRKEWLLKHEGALLL